MKSDEPSLAHIAPAAVVGAGTMGRGIASCFANAGIPVRVKEAREEALDAARDAMGSIYERSVTRGRLSSDEMQDRLSNILLQLDYADFAEASIVVEAAFENIAVKQAVFHELDWLPKETPFSPLTLLI